MSRRPSVLERSLPYPAGPVGNDAPSFLGSLDETGRSPGPALEPRSWIAGLLPRRLRRPKTAAPGPEQLNRRILDSLREQVAVVDRCGIVIAVNKAWKQIAGDHGTRPQAALGADYLAVCRRAIGDGCELASAALAGIEAVLRGEREAFELEYPCLAAAGQHWYVMTVTPLSGAEGGAIIVHRDDTTRRQAESALRATQERYLEVLESQTELVCRYLPDTTLTFVNASYCRFFGRKREDLIGRRFVELIPESAREWAVSHVAAMVAGTNPFTTEHEVLRPDGSIGWQQWNDSPILDATGRVVELQGIGRDITERKRLEEGLSRLAQASRVAVVGELTASIAHELSQPLGAIRTNADAAEMLLASHTATPTDLRSILIDIRSDALRANEVIRHVRTLLHEPKRLPEALDLAELAGEVVRLLKSEARRREVSLVIERSKRDLPVMGDRVALQQVLVNLIINSMEAVAGQPNATRRVLLSGFGTDAEAGMIVMDSGPGVPSELLPKLFDSFFTTKDEGMGLGLSLARSVVQAHGGRIWAQNNLPARGATFGFALPVSKPEPGTAARTPTRSAEEHAT